MSIEGSIVKGDYTPFWGSLEWEIKIDFNLEKLDDFEITFKNKSQQENTFEVNELCSVAQLFMRTLDLDEKFGDKLAITRLSNFLAEYLGKYLAPIYPDEVVDCLQDKKDRVQVKVKKMTTTDFYEALDFDEEDLAINFKQYYEDISALTFSEDEEELDTTNFAKYFRFLNNNYQISFKNSYMISGQQTESDNEEIFDKTDSKNIFLCKNRITNDKENNMEELVCIATIPLGVRVKDVRAKIFAPDNSELGVFQPTEINSTESNTIQILWKLDSLKSMHSVEFSHFLSKRVINIAEITVNNKREYLVYFEDIKDLEKESSKVNFPSLIDLSKDESVNKLVSIFPCEISFDKNSEFYDYIESLELVDKFREITWTSEFCSMNNELSQENNVIFLSNVDLLEEIKERSELPLEEEIIDDSTTESEVVEPEFTEDSDLDTESDIDLQDEKVAVEEVEQSEKEVETDSESSTDDLEEVLSSSDPVLLYNSKGILDHISELDDLSLFLRLRVPERERFTVILMNPFEMVAAHIEGGSLFDQPFRKFKLPLMKIEGTWVLKVQFLEEQIGSTTQYSLKIK
ncbi:MAG: hypothetical protein ACW967_06300 [Candidatus Hodarchaeales archaeon]|jgi:hypothetical protein